MKKSGIIAATVAAASATVASATSTASFTFTARNSLPHDDEGKKARAEESTDKFEPRFDGLKFIETLVTAHR